MKSKHPNSKEVTVYRKLPFAAEAQKDLADYYNAARYSVGSYWKDLNSKVIGSGMEDWEVKLLLPDLIGIDATDKDFRKEANSYFDIINTFIPPERGLTLQIGLSKDNDAILSPDNMPISVEEYVKYRHISGHPECAPSRDAAVGDPTKLCYVSDPTAEMDNESKRNALIDEATALYLSAKKDPAKVAKYLTLLGKDPDTVPKAKHISTLKDLVVGKPQEFIDLSKDESLNFRFFLAQLVKTKIVNKVGARYVDSETNKQLGVNEKDAVFYLQDKENENIVKLYKVKLAELSKESETTV